MKQLRTIDENSFDWKHLQPNSWMEKSVECGFNCFKFRNKYDSDNNSLKIVREESYKSLKLFALPLTKI